jgi:DNA-binding transcriptional ArsR family regulator
MGRPVIVGPGRLLETPPPRVPSGDGKHRATRSRSAASLVAVTTPVLAAPADTSSARLDGEQGRARHELLARFYRALGDPTRLALLEFCAAEERTGTECVAHVGLSQGRVSAHLSCLVSCGLLSVRREGRFAYYRVREPRVAELLRLGEEMVGGHAASIAACTRVAAPA